MSLGRNAEGEYVEKSDTIRGTKQDAIELLTRWNVEYYDKTIVATTHQTVAELYKDWIKMVKIYKAANTYRFYKEKWERFILNAIGHYVYTEVPFKVMQEVLTNNINEDKQIKNAMSAFFTWLVAQKKLKENPCHGLLVLERSYEKTEDDVWTFDEVQKIYEHLDFKYLYDIFIVLGVECGMRPQEILGLKWDKVFAKYISIESAVKDRKPGKFVIGSTKTKSSRRYWPLTPYVRYCLGLHRLNQLGRMGKNKNYVDNNIVVADKNGNVPDLSYIGKYMKKLAKKAGVKHIPPKNLRATWASLMNDLNVPLTIIQQGAGHEVGSTVTTKHYISIYLESLRGAAMSLHDKLHGEDQESSFGQIRPNDHRFSVSLNNSDMETMS